MIVATSERLRHLVPLIVVVLGAVVSIVVTAIGVAALPAWAVILGSGDITGAGAAAAYALNGPALHRVAALWFSIAFLAVTLGGSWLYSAAVNNGAPPANYVAVDNVTFSREPGGPPDTAYDAMQLLPGAVKTADCYTRVRNEVWLKFGGGWLSMSTVRTPAGYKSRLPPRCAGT